ncbi:MAG TPA: helix-turn-helix domain-containing protein [Burkholderiaceae bacterium]|jgi:AraC-like DNA-binding protein
MQLRLDRFDDFHVYGASAPEWNQRYQQISRGAMRSSMTEVRLGATHLFWKTLNQRVVQQGVLPMGKLCFAIPARAAGSARVQGREVTDHRIFVLRGGEEFVLHRPAQMELLAVTVDERQFGELLGQQPEARRLQALLRRTAFDVAPAALAELRAQLIAMFVWGDGATAYALPPRSDVAMEGLVHAGLIDVLQATGREGKRVRGLSAHVLVSECHRMTLARAESPPAIEELCARLRTSRRSLQDGFQKVAGTTPVDYLRSIRLNLVRTRLLKTLPHEASIGEIATHAGFSQLSHFASAYRRLFDELPSQTLRADALSGARPAARSTLS